MSNYNNFLKLYFLFFKKFFKSLFILIFKDQGKKLRENLEDVIGNNNKVLNTFSPEEKIMIRNILEFSEVNIESIKVPRVDIIAADIKTNIFDLFIIFSEGGCSRCPIYDGNLDKPMGMIHFKDMMNWFISNSISVDDILIKNFNLKKINFKLSISNLNIMRDVLYVPPSMMATDLLIKMQKKRIHMALVIDEYGGTDGLITIEDLVEKIVGQIEDEHDDENDLPSILEIDKYNYTADARLTMELFEKYLKVDFLSDDLDESVDTLGGLVFSIAGRIPIKGEIIKHSSGTIFEILDADSKRIKRVKIKLQIIK